MNDCISQFLSSSNTKEDCHFTTTGWSLYATPFYWREKSHLCASHVMLELLTTEQILLFCVLIFTEAREQDFTAQSLRMLFKDIWLITVCKSKPDPKIIYFLLYFSPPFTYICVLPWYNHYGWLDVKSKFLFSSFELEATCVGCMCTPSN